MAKIWIPLIGAPIVGRFKNPYLASNVCLAISGLALACTLGAWLDFVYLHNSPAHTYEATDHWHLATRILGFELLKIDHLSAPLLPLVALLYSLTILATLRTKIRRFSFAWTLFSEAMALAKFSCKEPWVVIALLAAGTVLPYLELKARGKPTRVYVLHMALFVGLMVVGWGLVEYDGDKPIHTLWAIGLLLLAVLVRSGIFPFHCWVSDLFENATFGSALLFVTPIAGAYAAIRLVIPIAPDWILRSLGLVSIVTAVYAAGMALVLRGSASPMARFAGKFWPTVTSTSMNSGKAAATAGMMVPASRVASTSRPLFVAVGARKAQTWTVLGPLQAG